VKTFVVAAGIIAALCFSARAADVPVKAPISGAPVVAAYNWTGFYVGINGGYGSGTTTGNLLPGSFFGNHDIRGGLFGPQIGFNYQMMSNLVVGLEADWDWANINGSQPLAIFTESAKVENLGTLRARIGYAWDSLLLYATGGWAWSTRVTASCPNCVLTPDSQSLNGYAVGAGLEYGISPNLSIKAEYLYTHLGSTDFFVSQGCPPGAGICNMGANVNLFRIGANWHVSPMTVASDRLTSPAGPMLSPSWQGLYLGAIAALGRMDTHDVAAFGISNDTGPLTGTGPLIGATLGYNWALAPQWLLGVEGDVSGGNVHAQTHASTVCAPDCETTMQWLGTIRGRAGYTSGPWLAYLTGGAAIAGFHAKQTGNFDFTETKVGGAAGGGAEYRLPGNWSLKAEYLYLWFGDGDKHSLAFLPGAAVSTRNTYTSLARIGLNKYF